MEILETISIDLDAQAIGEALQVERTGTWDFFHSAFEIARKSIDPRAVYAIRYVEARISDGVVIGGVPFRSRVLRKNLEDVERVFPYVATIGPELEERSETLNDLLERYYLDAIGNMALVNARRSLDLTLRSIFGLENLSFMSPGSLEDWPMVQQKPLFSLLDGGAHSIGVSLTDNCLMIPNKSVSGIYFPTETTFYNCQLCPRDMCVGRKAPYSQELAGTYGISNQKEGL